MTVRPVVFRDPSLPAFEMDLKEWTLEDQHHADMLDYYSIYLPSSQETITVSKHLWLVDRFADSTVDDGIKAVEHSFKCGLVAWADVARMVGYLVESVRQAGAGKTVIRTVHSRPDPVTTLGSVRGPMLRARDRKQYWEVWTTLTLDVRAAAAIKSGHRYAKGLNRDNYLKAGVKLIGAAAPRFGMVEDSLTAAVLDKMRETMEESQEEFDRLANRSRYAAMDDEPAGLDESRPHL